MLIGAVVVTFNPDVYLLKKAIESLNTQCDHILIVDNSTNQLVNFEINNKFAYIYNGSNIGIAAAQNIGIKFYQTKGFSHIIFSDQDSIFALDLVQELVRSMELIEQSGLKLAAIGPKVVNRRKSEMYINKNISGIFNEHIKLCDFIISSGSLVPIVNFDIVGLFEELLFIDCVDNEWCWRANHYKGLGSYVNEKAILFHSFGEGDKSLIWYKYRVSTPFRTFFQYRNYIYLLKQEYVPLKWKFKNFLKFGGKILIYIVGFKNRREYFLNISRGILEGLVMKK